VQFSVKEKPLVLFLHEYGSGSCDYKSHLHCCQIVLKTARSRRRSRMRAQFATNRQVEIPVDTVKLAGDLEAPAEAQGLVVFAHGSGSSRHSRRNQLVAHTLREGGLATLLFYLLTAQEEQVDHYTRHLRFDIELLARRVVGATDWLLQQPETQQQTIGYFGASTGAAAALIAATARPDVVAAVVSRGGRPDLAGPVLPQVSAATLLIVGGNDVPVIGMNQSALEQLRTVKRLEIIPGATHLFEEPGALEAVARLARDWFQHHLGERKE
jgi:dienelactone hydrolase